MNTNSDLTRSSNAGAPHTWRGKRQGIILLGMVSLALALIIAAAFTDPSSNRTAEVEKVSVPDSNALEMQYAQPWLDAQNKTAVPYSNALEMQYAQPWLDANKPLDCNSRLDLFYACQNGSNQQ